MKKLLLYAQIHNSSQVFYLLSGLFFFLNYVCTLDTKLTIKLCTEILLHDALSISCFSQLVKYFVMLHSKGN